MIRLEPFECHAFIETIIILKHRTIKRRDQEWLNQTRLPLTGFRHG
jgi:hypothetical protein